MVLGRSLLEASRGPIEVRLKIKTITVARPIEVKVSDRTLEDKARAGDAATLDSIVRTELPRVERLLIRILGPRRDLEDLVQTVFLEACRALPSFRGESTISTFIGGITVHVARRAMRSTPWWRRRGPMPEEQEDKLAADPGRQAMANEQLRRTRVALEKISPKKRVAFLLWAIEGMSIEAIAEMTDASVSATRSRIFYAQKELKKRAEHDPYLRDLIEENE